MGYVNLHQFNLNHLYKKVKYVVTKTAPYENVTSVLEELHKDRDIWLVMHQ